MGFTHVYVGDESPEDQAMLVTEKCCFRDLVDGLSSPCQCGLTMRPWQLESLTQVNTNDMHAHVCSSVPTCTYVDPIHLSISERTCAPNCFHLSPLSPTKDMVKFAGSQWTLPGQPKVVY